MPTPILMPALSPTMTEGKIARWLKKEGDRLKSGDVMLEIETDKATMEVECVDEGTLGKITVAAGTEGVKVNAVVGYILAEGENPADIQTVAAQTALQFTPQSSTQSAAKSAPKATAITAATAVTVSGKAGRIIATPLARVIAKQQGIDLATVRGTGPNGRIVKADLEGAKTGTATGTARQPVPQNAATGTALAVVGHGATPFELIPHSTMRKVIAKRLTEAKRDIPHFYAAMDIELDALLALRVALNKTGEKEGFKLSVNDFVVRACAVALTRHPEVNSAWSDEGMRKFSRVDISIAVSIPAGLITPIVFDAANKSLKQISTEVKELAGKARAGKLQPHEYQGGTFSISNLGMYGVTSFTPIINPPQSCILGVGAGLEKAVAHGGKIEAATVMNCTLSADHRAVDGVLGAEYLQTLKGLLEDPLSLLV